MDTRELGMVPLMDLSLTDFTVDIDRGAAQTVIKLVGELDFATAPRVRAAVEAVRDESPHAIVIDLSGLTFMDSTGIHVIIWACAANRSADSPTVSLRRGAAAVQRVLEVAGIEDRLPFLDD